MKSLSSSPSSFAPESLSDLYQNDLDQRESAILLPYPSSSEWETFRNSRKYTIQDGPTPESKVGYETVHRKEPWRHLSMLGNNLPGIVTELPPEFLIQYWKDQFGFSYENIVHYSHKSYCNDINMNGHKQVVTLFPYQHIQNEKHAVDPDQHYHLLSKMALSSMNIPIPEQKVIEVNKDFFSSFIPPFSYPFVIKTAHGLSGDGTFLIKSPDDLSKVMQTVQQYYESGSIHQIVCQEFVKNAVENHGVQFYLNRAGKVQFMGSTGQVTSSEGAFQGGVIDYSVSNYQKFQEIIENVGAYAHAKDYFGVIGLDILEDREGKLSVIDGNFRLTGLTPLYLLKKRFTQEQKNRAEFSTNWEFEGNLDQLLSTLYQELNKQIFVVLSAAEKDNGKTDIYGIVSGENETQLESHKTLLHTKGLSIS